MFKELKTIVYIEDDDDIRTVVEMALRLSQWKIFVCESGTEGLKVIQRESPDLVLIDVMMPGMDGPSTLEVLKDNPQTKSIPVIFMTAKVQSEEIKKYKLLGACGVISKPFDPMMLTQKIREIWGEIQEKSVEDLKNEIQDLQQSYARRLVDKIKILNDSWHKITHQSAEKKDWDVFYQTVHKLAGSGSSFGLPRVSEIGNDLQKIFSTIADKGYIFDEFQKKQIGLFLSELQDHVPS